MLELVEPLERLILAGQEQSFVGSGVLLVCLHRLAAVEMVEVYRGLPVEVQILWEPAVRAAFATLNFCEQDNG